MDRSADRDFNSWALPVFGGFHAWLRIVDPESGASSLRPGGDDVNQRRLRHPVGNAHRQWPRHRSMARRGLRLSHPARNSVRRRVTLGNMADDAPAEMLAGSFPVNVL